MVYDAMGEATCTWSKRSVVRGHNVSLDALFYGIYMYTCTCKIYNASPNVLHIRRCKMKQYNSTSAKRVNNKVDVQFP